MPLHAKFERLSKDLKTAVDQLAVQFNPTEYTLNKGVQFADIPIPGLDMPIVQFVRGQTETLSLDLFFDTTDDGMGETAKPVTEKTDKFYQLIKIDRDMHAPPICRFTWGKGGFPGSQFTGKWSSQKRQNGFQCVVESVRQRFTLFNPEGVPLRAILTVTLREYRTLKQQIQEIRLASPDHTKTHVIRIGETLSGIADEVYGDPGAWRYIADHNGILDPLQLRPGRTLEIPPILSEAQ